MKSFLFGLGIVVTLLAYDFMRIPVPSENKDVFKTRFFLYMSQKLTYVPMNLRTLVFGRDYAHTTWLDTSRVPYVAKPDRIEDGLQIVDKKFDNVPVRIYDPLKRENLGPAVLFIHGGGWVIGSVESYDEYCRDMSKALNMIVVSVEYRLAPENKYPVPFQDCVNAAKHFIENAAEYDVDASRIAIAGDSAGGNLAATVSLKLRDVDVEPQPKLQVLIYPVTQCFDFKLPSFVKNVGDPVIREDMLPLVCLLYAQGNSDYLDYVLGNSHTPKSVKSKFSSIFNHDIITGRGGSTPEPAEGNSQVWDKLKDIFLDPYFAPLFADNLEDLPKTLMYTVEQDPLRDEGKLYAHRLKEAGVDVEHYHNKAGFHALNSIGSKLFDTIDAKESNSYIWNFIKENI